MAGQERFVRGFAVLLSRRELDVVAVYTASRDPCTGLPPREQEAPRNLRNPAGSLPGTFSGAIYPRHTRQSQ